jgi:hypothetical protein
MGFSKCYLSSVENLQKEFNNVGLESFIKRYRKYYCIIGPSESFRFLEEKQKEYGLQQISLVDKGKTEKTIEP